MSAVGERGEPRAVRLDGAAPPLGAYPHLKVVGPWIFVSGTSSRRPDGTIEGVTAGEQTSAVLARIRMMLQSVGADLDDLVQVTSYLVDMADFDDYNAAYAACMPSQGPARTTVAVLALPGPQLRIEIQAIGFRSTAAPQEEP